MTTQQTQHTSGPWITDDETVNHGPIIIQSNGSIEVAAIYGDSREQRAANARLIAAAPTMYEAIRDTLDLAQPELPSHIVKQLSAALNAADGGK